MAGTDKHKLYGAVLAVAAGALIVDRFVLSGDALGPQSAAASTGESGSAEAGEASADGDAGAGRSKADRRPVFSQRLALAGTGLDAAVGERNPFQFVVAEELPATEPTATAPAPAPVVQDATEPFRSTHRLQGILASQGVGIAVVNGRSIRVGEEIGGYTLVSVQGRTAQFQRGTLQVNLSLD